MEAVEPISVKPFPLFSLPAIPFYDILKEMRSVDIRLTLTSKNPKIVFETDVSSNECRQNRWAGMELKYKKTDSKYLSISVNSEYHREPTNTWKVGKYRIPIKDGGDYINFIWKHQIETHQFLAQAICEAFRIKNLSFHVEYGYGYEATWKLFDNILKFRNHLKVPIFQFKITSLYLNMSIYSDMLDRLSDTPRLIITGDSYQNFTYDHQRPYPKEYLEIDHAEWIRLKDLMLLLKCKQVRLHHVMYVTDRDWNTFLVKWMEGCKLVQINIYGNVIDFDVILGKIPRKPNKTFWICRDNMDVQLENCYEIEREDGTKLYIAKDDHNLILFNNKE
ncbi:hypothetical protein CRE_28587 [Caenorhabditis remanei]|uniref:Sdz-33 F-box domain-containing protein n=1 Tax=Caenorhabditis remanei TaxID=31234 RepID=E3LN76_CAERE|nr:hypothetical protein CRE_28587 [Caenorhabditis remanei]